MFGKKIYNLGDRLEDRVRGRLSHYPIIYAFIGGAGVIIFWRGVWLTVDYLMESLFTARNLAMDSESGLLLWWDGPLSILIGAALLLATGLFVASFIGNEIIISGLKNEKKLGEKTEEEIKLEVSESNKLKHEVMAVNDRLKDIENMLKNR